MFRESFNEDLLLKKKHLNEISAALSQLISLISDSPKDEAHILFLVINYLKIKKVNPEVFSYFIIIEQSPLIKVLN